MTANTIISHVATQSPIDPVSAEVVHGILASTYGVGTWVYESAKGTWTALTATISAWCGRVGVVGYKPRLLASKAPSTIDSLYTTTDVVPIVLSGLVPAFVDDPGAGTGLLGGGVSASSNAGKSTIMTDNDPRLIGVLQSAVPDNDLVGIVRIGNKMNAGA